MSLVASSLSPCWWCVALESCSQSHPCLSGFLGSTCGLILVSVPVPCFLHVDFLNWPCLSQMASLWGLTLWFLHSDPLQQKATPCLSPLELQTECVVCTGEGGGVHVCGVWNVCVMVCVHVHMSWWRCTCV
jgi:hypothetical protein